MFETERLRLHRFRDEDLDPFAALNADPVVMEHFPRPQTREETADAIKRINALIDRDGFGFWAVTRKDTNEMIGFTGITRTPFETPFTPCVEVGWRLARKHWGFGFAFEAARFSVRHGFDVVGLEEIVSFTVPGNVRSRRVMERLGMTHDEAGGFDHPRIPDGHPLKRHVLYRLARSAR